MKEERDKFHLERIIQAADQVKKYISGFSFENFVKDEKTYDATIMQIEHIGETITRLSENFKEKHGDLPWHDAIGMRNQIAHGYLEIKPKVVWRTAKHDLPQLKSKLGEILK